MDTVTKEGEGLPAVLCVPSFVICQYFCCCMPTIKPVNGERHMIISFSRESLEIENKVYFCHTWPHRRESVSEQPGSFRKERIVCLE